MSEGYGIPGLFDTPAADVRSRLKMVFYGEAGAGKTILAIQFPAPLIVDCEYGWDVYKELYPQIPFAEAPTFDKAEKLVDAVYKQGTKVKAQTLIIDPVTTLYSNLRATHLTEDAMEGKAFGTAGFAAVDRDWNKFMSKVARLSRRMNVIMIAREKNVFEKKGETTFDAGRGLDYYADIVLQLVSTKDGRYLARCEKERMIPSRLPSEGLFNPWEGLIQHYRSSIYGGLTKPQEVEIRERLQFDDSKGENKERLSAAFGVDKISELSSYQATQIIKTLREELKEQERAAG